jgi:aspartate aminotransferase
MQDNSKKDTGREDENVSIYDVFSQEHSENSNPINLTVGNPNLPPPPLYYEAMTAVLNEITAQKWNGHGYMVAEDPFGLCAKLANYLREQFNVPFESKDVRITVGATGALDVISKTVLDPAGPCASAPEDNEVIVVAPYFVEYINIIEANGGIPVVVHSNERFGLDLEALDKAIRPRTKMIWINSPNNPTGTIYSANELKELAALVKRKENAFGKKIYVVEDAVYDTIHFLQGEVPSMVTLHPHLFRVNSWSKSLSLAGERIGHFATHPYIGTESERNDLRDALFLNMRMRVVHAPLLQHRILARLPVDCVTDIEYYRRNIKTLYNTLKSLGFDVLPPKGTFYLWAVLPSCLDDEKSFRNLVMDGNDPLLYLPGVMFGGERYRRCVRFSACVAFEDIQRACVKLKKIFDEYGDTASAMGI